MIDAGHWISPQLAEELLSGGTNAFRIASGHGFWIERLGDTAMISLRSARMRLCLQMLLEKLVGILAASMSGSL
jgi:hypothetical protein